MNINQENQLRREMDEDLLRRAGQLPGDKSPLALSAELQAMARKMRAIRADPKLYAEWLKAQAVAQAEFEAEYW